MARVPNRFIDPVTATVYDWPVNHNEEDETGKRRNFDRGAPTARPGNSGVGLIRHQSADEPLVLRWRGRILHQSQFAQMIGWWKLCETQSIHVRDFTLAEYEVVIASFTYQRKGVVRNAKDPVNAPLWVWDYTLEMEVLTFVGGEYALFGVTP